MKLTPKNWTEFQHYKDRAPAWIKLHRNILDDYEFHMLPVASKALAPCIWLLASEYTDGCIDAKPVKIAFRLRMTEQELIDALRPLVDSGFFLADEELTDMLHGASNVLAECKLESSLEKRREEGEKEAEREEEKEVAPTFQVVASVSGRKRASADLAALDVSQQVADDWLAVRKAKRAGPVTQTVLDAMQREATSAGITLADAIRICAERGWQGFKAAWMTKEPAPSADRFRTSYDRTADVELMRQQMIKRGIDPDNPPDVTEF